MNKYSASRRSALTGLVTELSVLASSMLEALAWFTVQFTGEPATIFTAEENLSAASSIATVAVTTVIDPTLYAAGARVYPESANVPIGSNVIFTAVSPAGHTFVNFVDAAGTVLGTTAVSTISITEAVAITAVFA